MKKLSIIFASVIFLLIAGNRVFAQEFNGGVMAGLVASQVAGDSFSGFNKAGIFAGGFVNLEISPRSVFQMELELFQKGSRKNPDSENNDYESYLFRTFYVELPVLYQYVISPRFKIEAGPSGGFLLAHYEERNEEVLSDRPDYNKPAAVTLQFNVGLYVNFTPNLAVNIRTNNSLFNIRGRNASGDVWRFWSYGQYNDSLVLSLFYTFRKKGNGLSGN